MWIYEHEAGDRICPHTQNSCLGQRCMAWRWGFINKIDDPNYQGRSFTNREVGIADGKFPPDQRFRGRKGFCGLAGKPNE